MFLKPWTFDPCHLSVLIHLAVTFPDMVAVITEQMFNRPAKSVKIFLIKRSAIDPADSPARVIEVWLVVVVNKYIDVKSPVPASPDIRCVFPIPDAGVWSKRIISFKDRTIIAAHIKTSVVF